MKQLVDDLKELNMISDELYFSFMKGSPIAGGLLGALIENSKTFICSINTEYLYLFKIKNSFSYKGIKSETIQKIKLADISMIEWRPKTFTGYFKIFYNGEKITGTLSRGEENKEKFEKCLSFLEEYPNIVFKVR